MDTDYRGQREIERGGRSGEFDQAFPGIIGPSPSPDLAGPMRDETDRAVEEGVELEGVVELELVVVVEFEILEGAPEAGEFEADQTDLTDQLNYVLNQACQPDRPAKDPP